MPRQAFHDPRDFPFVPELEGAVDAMRAELDALGPDAFVESPDSLTTTSDEGDERGWLWFGLHGEDAPAENRARCPVTSRACEAVPGLVNSGLSLFRPGTRLFPHQGELEGVLRCHLPLRVPAGDVGMRVDGETRAWRSGECLVFDDSLEHTAWNLGDGDRVVLIVTFRP